MSKLLRNGERDGTCYLEFQFCDTDKPLKDGKVRCEILKHWSDNSLYMDWDDFGKFYKLYGDLFSCAVFPNGERGCDSCGVNYCGKEETAKIVEGLSACPNEEYTALPPMAESRGETGQRLLYFGSINFCFLHLIGKVVIKMISPDDLIVYD